MMRPKRERQARPERCLRCVGWGRLERRNCPVCKGSGILMLGLFIFLFLLFTFAAHSATVTGTIRNRQGAVVSTNINFKAIQRPLFDGTPSVLPGWTMTTNSDAAGFFSTPLLAGNYQVTVGAESRDSFLIQVPTNNASYEVSQLVTNLAAYTFTGIDFDSAINSLNGLATPVQTFAIDTNGSLSITSSGSTHTFHIPPGGTSSGGGTATNNVGNVLFVRTNGVNATAVRGQEASAWAGVLNAHSNALAGDIVKIEKGTYSAGTNRWILKHDVSYEGAGMEDTVLTFDTGNQNDGVKIVPHSGRLAKMTLDFRSASGFALPIGRDNFGTPDQVCTNFLAEDLHVKGFTDFLYYQGFDDTNRFATLTFRRCIVETGIDMIFVGAANTNTTVDFWDCDFYITTLGQTNTSNPNQVVQFLSLNGAGAGAAVRFHNCRVFMYGKRVRYLLNNDPTGSFALLPDRITFDNVTISVTLTNGGTNEGWYSETAAQNTNLFYTITGNTDFPIDATTAIFTNTTGPQTVWFRSTIGGTNWLPPISHFGRTNDSGLEIEVFDAAGTAGTSNITIRALGGALINGADTATIDRNYGRHRLIQIGTNWFTKVAVAAGDVTTAQFNSASNNIITLLSTYDTATSNGAVAFAMTVSNAVYAAETTRNAAVSNALASLLVANDTTTSNGLYSLLVGGGITAATATNIAQYFATNSALITSNALMTILVANDITTSNGAVAFTMAASNLLYTAETTRNAAVSNALASFVMTASNDVYTTETTRNAAVSNAAVAFTMTASNLLYTAETARHAAVSNACVTFGMTVSNAVYVTETTRNAAVSNDCILFAMTVSNAVYASETTRNAAVSNSCVSFSMTMSNTLYGFITSGATNLATLASGSITAGLIISTNGYAGGVTNLGTNASVSFDLASSHWGIYRVRGNGTVSFTNSIFTTGPTNVRKWVLEVADDGVATGTLTLQTIGPIGVNWQGTPFKGSSRTNKYDIEWNGYWFTGSWRQDDTTGTGANVLSNAPAVLSATLITPTADYLKAGQVDVRTNLNTAKMISTNNIGHLISTVAGVGGALTNFTFDVQAARRVYVDAGKTNVNIVGMMGYVIGQAWPVVVVGTNRTATPRTLSAGTSTNNWIATGTLTLPQQITNAFLLSTETHGTNVFYCFRYLANPAP